jgi:hypothetical protein
VVVGVWVGRFLAFLWFCGFWTLALSCFSLRLFLFLVLWFPSCFPFGFGSFGFPRFWSLVLGFESFWVVVSFQL